MWADGFATTVEAEAATRVSALKHILVVDDDTNVLRIVASALSGYGVSVARNGHEALWIVRTDPVDLLIVDYLMPSMTGQELITICEAEGATFPVLVLTGYGDILEREEPTWWATRPHLTKPVHIDALRAAATRLIGGP